MDVAFFLSFLVKEFQYIPFPHTAPFLHHSVLPAHDVQGFLRHTDPARVFYAHPRSCYRQHEVPRESNFFFVRSPQLLVCRHFFCRFHPHDSPRLHSFAVKSRALVFLARRFQHPFLEVPARFVIFFIPFGLVDEIVIELNLILRRVPSSHSSSEIFVLCHDSPDLPAYRPELAREII